MSLWVDKYRPTSLGKLDYHKEQATQLKNLVGNSTKSVTVYWLAANFPIVHHRFYEFTYFF